MEVTLTVAVSATMERLSLELTDQDLRSIDVGSWQVKEGEVKIH